MYSKLDSIEDSYREKNENFIDRDLFEKQIAVFPDLKNVLFQKEYDQAEFLKLIEGGELTSLEKDIGLVDVINHNPYFEFRRVSIFNSLLLKKDL